MGSQTMTRLPKGWVSREVIINGHKALCNIPPSCFEDDDEEEKRDEKKRSQEEE